MEILRRNAETVEVVGLDEAYVDLTGLFSPKATMRRIAAEIREETGLTCSVGISENRLLAKIVSELGKPAGLVVLSRKEALERFAAESPGLVPGIGPKTTIRLQTMGIRTLADLGARQREELEGAFGPRSGAWLHARGQLWDETPISVSRETKSQSVETTFDVDVRQRGELESCLAEQAAELCQRLRKRELEGRTIGIKLRLDDWTNVSRSHTLDAPTADPEIVDSSRARPAARLRPAAAGAPARRPRRRLQRRSCRRARAGSDATQRCGLEGPIPVGVERLVLFRRVPTRTAANETRKS